MSSAPGRADAADAPNPRDKRRAAVLTVDDSDDENEWAEHTPSRNTRPRITSSLDEAATDSMVTDMPREMLEQFARMQAKFARLQAAMTMELQQKQLAAEAETARMQAEIQRLRQLTDQMESRADMRSHFSRMSSSPPTPEFDVDAKYIAIIDDIEGKTGFTDLTPNLNFDYRAFVHRVLVKLSEGDTSALICGGNTQSQKTGFKVVMYIIAHSLHIGTIVVTKGVPESQDLAHKIKSLLGNRPAADHVDSQTKNGRGSKGEDMDDILIKAGCIVSAHTGGQVRKNLRAVSTRRFVTRTQGFFLILDEADDYERSPKNGPQTQIEQAHAELWRDGMPLLVAGVTATMPPLFTSEMYASVTGEDVFFTKQDNYSGVLDTVHFKDHEGNMVVIPHNATGPKNSYMCPEVWKFYEAASKTKRALLLDVMSPRVLAAANNFERSKLIQERFPNVCFVVVTGTDSFVLRPGHEDFEEPRKLNEVKVGAVLTELDKEMGNTPIFVLGYSKMERSISYRADGRVPTHMTVSIGGTMSFERLIQTLGRCTGRHFPAGHKVVVLSNGLDYDAARAYVRFQSSLVKQMRRHKESTVADIIENHTFKDEENFWAFTVRTVAQKRAARSWLFNLNREEFEIDGDHRGGFRAAYKCVNWSAILWHEQLIDIFLKHGGRFLSLATLREGVNERLKEDGCSETLLRKSLAALVREKLVVKCKSGMTWMWNDVGCREM